MTTDQWVTAVVAIFGALGIREMIPALGRWVTGGADREKARVQQIIHDRDAAERRAEREGAHRRIMDEYASALRRDLIEAGVDPEDLRPWPD